MAAQVVQPVKSTVNGTDFWLDPKYKIIKTVGTGAYGIVVSALDTQTGHKVAVKKVPTWTHDIIDGKRVLREVRMLRFFRHENVSSICDMEVPPSGRWEDMNDVCESRCDMEVPPSGRWEDMNDVYIMTPLFEADLHKIIYSKQKLTDDHIAYFIYQVLRGLKYIHSANVLHRDLKPSNLLVNSNCDLAICDFGLARGVHAEGTHALTEYVVTRWYRAPEIMLGNREYTRAVDVWSVGCILGELIRRKPLFAGSDYMDQLRLITATIGSPDEADLRSFVRSERALAFMGKHAGKPRTPWSTIFKTKVNPSMLDLLDRMLVWNPAHRISVDEALSHPFLASLHCPSDEPVATGIFDYSFESNHLDANALKKLMFTEVIQLKQANAVALQQQAMAASSGQAAGETSSQAGASGSAGPSGASAVSNHSGNSATGNTSRASSDGRGGKHSDGHSRSRSGSCGGSGGSAAATDDRMNVDGDDGAGHHHQSAGQTSSQHLQQQQQQHQQDGSSRRAQPPSSTGGQSDAMQIDGSGYAGVEKQIDRHHHHHQHYSTAPVVPAPAYPQPHNTAMAHAHAGNGTSSGGYHPSSGRVAGRSMGEQDDHPYHTHGQAQGHAHHQQMPQQDHTMCAAGGGYGSVAGGGSGIHYADQQLQGASYAAQQYMKAQQLAAGHYSSASTNSRHSRRSTGDLSSHPVATNGATGSGAVQSRPPTYPLPASYAGAAQADSNSQQHQHVPSQRISTPESSSASFYRVSSDSSGPYGSHDPDATNSADAGGARQGTHAAKRSNTSLNGGAAGADGTSAAYRAAAGAHDPLPAVPSSHQQQSGSRGKASGMMPAIASIFSSPWGHHHNHHSSSNSNRGGQQAAAPVQAPFPVQPTAAGSAGSPPPPPPPATSLPPPPGHPGREISTISVSFSTGWERFHAGPSGGAMLPMQAPTPTSVPQPASEAAAAAAAALPGQSTPGLSAAVQKAVTGGRAGAHMDQLDHTSESVTVGSTSQHSNGSASGRGPPSRSSGWSSATSSTGSGSQPNAAASAAAPVPPATLTLGKTRSSTRAGSAGRERAEML